MGQQASSSHADPAGRCKELTVKTRTELQGTIEQIDATMLHAANEVPDTSQHWKAWGLATAGLPSMDEVPRDLGYWWQN